MADSVKVKWAIDSDEPDDLQDFLSNDEIEDKYGMPKNGIYRLVLRQIKIRKIANGDNAGRDRLNVMLVIKEPKGSDKAKWNGYAVFDGLNVTDQGKKYIKRLLNALGLEWNDFTDRSKRDKQDPPHLVQIGRLKVETAEALLTASLKQRSDAEYGDSVEVSRYILPKDADEEPVDDDDDDDVEEDEDVEVMDEDVEDEDSDEEEDDDDDEDDEDEDDEDEEDEDEDDEEDPEEDLRGELADLSKAALEKRLVRSAKKAKVKDYDMPKTKAKLIDAIVRIELDEPPF